MKNLVNKIKEIINWLLNRKKHIEEKYCAEKCFNCCGTGLMNLGDYDDVVEIQEGCDYCDAEPAEYTIGEDGCYVVEDDALPKYTAK